MQKEPVKKKRIHCEWCGGKLKRDMRGTTCCPSCSNSLMRHKQIMKDKEIIPQIEVMQPRKRRWHRVLLTDEEQIEINKQATRRRDRVDALLTFEQGIQLYRHNQAAWLLG